MNTKPFNVIALLLMGIFALFTFSFLVSGTSSEAASISTSLVAFRTAPDTPADINNAKQLCLQASKDKLPKSIEDCEIAKYKLDDKNKQAIEDEIAPEGLGVVGDYEACLKYKEDMGFLDKVEYCVEHKNNDAIKEKLQQGASYVAETGSNNFLNQIADSFGKSVSEMLLKYEDQWINDKSMLNDPSSVTIATNVRNVIYPLALFVVVAGILWQSVVMVLTRRSQPLVDVIRGLFTFSIWSTIGVTFAVKAVQISDDMAEYFYGFTKQMNGGNAKTGFLKTMSSVMAGGTPDYQDILTRLLLGPILWISVFILKGIFMYRDIAVVILAGMLVLAAAGAFTESTKGWLIKILNWMLALVAYKPMAALVYLVATMFYKAGSGVNSTEKQFYAGTMTIFLTVLLLPTIMRFFSWATGQASGGPSISNATSVLTSNVQYGLKFR